MTLTQLRYLIALDEHRNFASAAEHSCVSQPTLSLQVKKLETTVGEAIWNRNRSPIEPTSFGVQFIQQARKILLEVDQLEQLYCKEAPNLEGELSIGIIPTVASYLFLNLYQLFAAEFPALKLSIQELPTSQILDRLESGQVDAAILAGPIQHRHINEQPLFYEPFCIYLNPSNQYPHKQFKYADLKTLPLLMLSEEHCLRGQTLKLCKHNELRGQHTQLECSNIEIMKNLVKADVASAVLPQLCLTDLDANQTKSIPTSKRGYLPQPHILQPMLEFESPKPARVISLVYRKNFYMHRRLDAIVELVSRLVPNEFLTKHDMKIIGIEHNV